MYALLYCCCILSTEKGGGAVEERLAGEAGFGGDQAADTHTAPSAGRRENYHIDLQPEPELSSSDSPQRPTSSRLPLTSLKPRLVYYRTVEVVPLHNVYHDLLKKMRL